MTSIQGRFFSDVVLPLLGIKRTFSDTQRARRAFAADAARPARHKPPRILFPRVQIASREVRGWPIYELTSCTGEIAGTIVYFHGGAYVYEITKTHWWFLAWLAAKSQRRIIVPIYPLGAAAGAHSVVATATSITREVIDTYGEATVLMGDSAGGGLAVAVSQQLRDQNAKAGGLVLLSPWLDAEVGDPRQARLESADRMLGIAGLREAARQYAAGLPLAHSLVSPVNGSAVGLPPVTIFTSTADLLAPDSYRFEVACAAAGTLCRVLTASGAPHAFALLPIPEGRAARQTIRELLIKPNA